MENYSGTIHSKFLANSSKGHTASVALLTVIIDPLLDWDEFETIPEELHLTNLEFEVFQVKDTNAFENDYLKSIKQHHRKYDHKILMLINTNLPELTKHYASLMLLNSESKIETNHSDVYYPTEQFEKEMDIGMIEEMRFWINDRL